MQTGMVTRLTWSRRGFQNPSAICTREKLTGSIFWAGVWATAPAEDDKQAPMSKVKERRVVGIGVSWWQGNKWDLADFSKLIIRVPGHLAACHQ
jgi:hypothetical protein